MSLIKAIIVRMPAFLQDRMVEKAMRTGKIFNSPVFDMLLRTLEFYGGNIEEIKEVLKTIHANNSMKEAFDKAGIKKIALGDVYSSKREYLKAQQTYFEAMTYFFLLEYFTDDLNESRRNYEKYMPVYERYCKLASPQINRIELPYKKGAIKAQYRVPDGDGPFPAIIIIQGNEGSKEHMVSFENYALLRGMATLSVDPPGYGETRLTNITWDTQEDFKICIHKAVDFLYMQKVIEKSAIGIFGVSGGGLLSHYASSFEKRISASAGLGGTSAHTFVKAWKYALVSQKRKSFRYTGTNNLKDCEMWMNQLQNDLLKSLPNIDVPNLWVNGTDDMLVEIRDIQVLTEALGAKSEFIPIERGDHLCSQYLSHGLADLIFDWLSNKLDIENKLRSS